MAGEPLLLADELHLGHRLGGQAEGRSGVGSGCFGGDGDGGGIHDARIYQAGARALPSERPPSTARICPVT